MKERPQPLYHRISKHVLLVSLFTVALLSIGGRVLWSQVEYFKNEIEREFEDYGITGVHLDAISGGWRGLHPLLRVDGASLSIPGRSDALSISQMELSVKLFSSLFHSDLEVLSLHSNIEKLIVVRDEDGAWWLNDIALNAQGDGSRIDIHAFFARLPDFTQINVRLLQIRDLRQGNEYLIQHVHLHSSREAGELSLKLDGSLPYSLGRDVTIQLRGDAQRQQMYIEAERLNLASLGGLADAKLPGIDQAEVSLQGWVDLVDYRVQRVISDLEFSEVMLTSSRSEVKAPASSSSAAKAEVIRFRTRMQAQRDAEAWQLDVKADKISRGDQKQPSMEAQLVLFHDASPLQFWIKRIDVQALRDLLADLSLVANYSEVLDQLGLRASIDDLVVELDLDDPAASSLSFDFARLRARRLGKVPGINGFSGRVLAAQRRGQLQLDSERVALDFGDFFRLPLKLDYLRSAVDFEWSPQRLILHTDEFSLGNADAAAKGRASIEIPRDGRPFLALRAQYQDGKVSATSRYLPVAVMPEKAVAWLDASLKDGTVPKGDLLFHGRLKSLKHFTNDASGEFHALFDARAPVIEPYGGWPRIQQGNGRVSFHNTAMDIHFDRTRFASSDVEKVRVQIPDLFHSELLIDVQTPADADKLLDSLAAMPVLDVFDLVRDRTEAISGSLRADVNILVPLHHDPEAEVSVTAQAKLDGLRVHIPDWMVDVDQLSGTLDVDNQWISAQQLKGLYAGDPVSVDLLPDRAQKLANISMSGSVDAKALTVKLPAALGDAAIGRGQWQVDVAIPTDDSFAQRGVSVHARSDLEGVELTFAQPLRVEKDAKAPIEVMLNIREGDIDFSTRLRDRLAAVGKLRANAEEDFDLQSLHLAFGSNQLPARSSKGIVVNGRVAQLDVNGWLGYQSKHFNGSGGERGSLLSQVAAVDLVIDQAKVASQRVDNAYVKLERKDDALQGLLVSPLIKGQVKIPHQVSGARPIEAELEYIRWRKGDDTEFDPSIEDMPDLLIRSELLAYDEVEFNDFVLHSGHQGDRYVVEQFDVVRDAVRLKSSGHWQVSAGTGEQVSVFNIDIRGKNFGKTVENLGLGKGIRKGEVAFNGQIGWGGNLFDINWPTLIGEVQLSLKDGALSDVEPGAGRFVGLLSLNALPRRLFLDFSDVFAEGMQFDEIKGRFSIAGEIMKTDNAVMKSDAAEVRIEGTTNLREQTYDQRMYIVPQIGDTLPIIGGLAAGNAVGWGLLLLQKIFEKPIDKSVEIEYKVSGSWEDPEIKLISAPPPEQDDQEPLLNFDR